MLTLAAECNVRVLRVTLGGMLAMPTTALMSKNKLNLALA